MCEQHADKQHADGTVEVLQRLLTLPPAKRKLVESIDRRLDLSRAHSISSICNRCPLTAMIAHTCDKFTAAHPHTQWFLLDSSTRYWICRDSLPRTNLHAKSADAWVIKSTETHYPRVVHAETSVENVLTVLWISLIIQWIWISIFSLV